MALQPQNIEILRCAILNDLQNEAVPNPADYLGNKEEELNYEGFVKMIFDLQAEGLITGVVFAMEQQQVIDIDDMSATKLTEKGEEHLASFFQIAQAVWL